ncbi:MAG: DUF2079 domain-containing protein [bacterium]|nr:DUF2079 domain-containing protein [bacterium]
MIKILNKKAGLILLLWIIVLSVLYSALSILRHDHFQSGGFDLGIYDQSVWQYSKLLAPFNTIKYRFILGDHLSLTLPLLSPLFYLWDNVRMLLIFQAFWISFSTFAVFKIIRNRNFSPLVSLNVSFVYSLFYGIQSAVFFDFHPVVIGVGLIAWLIYFLETKKTKLFWLTFVLVILTQENMGIALASLGLIYMFKKEYRKLSIFFISFGFLDSLISSRIIALFSPVGFQYWPEISLNPIKTLVNFFDSPEKRQVWFYSLSWFSFLPLLSPGSIMAVVLDLSQYFVTGSGFSGMWSPFMHHRAILAPFLLLGVLDVLIFLKKRRISPELISIFLVIVSLSLQFVFHFPLNKLSKSAYWKTEQWMIDNKAIIKIIPTNASIASQQSLVPHISHRKEIYMIWPKIHDFSDKTVCGKKSCWWLDFGGKPEYLFVDLHPNQWVTQLLETNENFESAVSNMEKTGEIKLVKEVNYARLYKVIY